jgi:hypothetical protein
VSRPGGQAAVIDVRLQCSRGLGSKKIFGWLVEERRCEYAPINACSGLLLSVQKLECHMALEVNTAILDVICEQRFERLQIPLALNMNECVGGHVTFSLCPSVDPGV